MPVFTPEICLFSLSLRRLSFALVMSVRQLSICCPISASEKKLGVRSSVDGPSGIRGTINLNQLTFECCCWCEANGWSHLAVAMAGCRAVHPRPDDLAATARPVVKVYDDECALSCSVKQIGPVSQSNQGVFIRLSEEGTICILLALCSSLSDLSEPFFFLEQKEEEEFVPCPRYN